VRAGGGSPARRRPLGLADALEAGAAAGTGGFTFLGEARGVSVSAGGGAQDPAGETWSLGALHARAAGVAVALGERGLRPAERVVVILPRPEAFLPAFLGVMLAGAVPVPLYPPLTVGAPGGYLELVRHVVAAAGARFVLTAGSIAPLLGALPGRCPELHAILDGERLEGDASAYRTVRPAAEDTAFLQFTSGSTGRPKGVVLTYANLAANCRAIMEHGLRAGPGDRGVSWLPLSHDMGLIGFVLAPIFYGQPVTLLTPTAFVRRPALWLQTLARHRGTVTFAPNFAYGLAARRVRDADMEGLDLSALRVAGCGAEPVHASTLRAFARRFAPYGFSAAAFRPSYGMAESTLAIAFGRGLVVDRVRRDALSGEGRAVPAGSAGSAVPPDGGAAGRPAPEAEDGADGADGADGVVEVVGCGRAFPGHAVRIAGPDGDSLPERRVGEIAVRGPSVSPGYFRDPAATAATFDAGWLRTGDLGYLAGGQLFVCGRRKDLIVVNGRKYHPQDVEWAAGVVPGVREGKVVAFSTTPPGWEREAVVVALETRADVPLDDLGPRVRSAVSRATGLRVDVVLGAESGALPKTSSGKAQRALTRTLYLAGALGEQAWTPPPGAAPQEAA
jgi:fatty-acyl-CoA synthase